MPTSKLVIERISTPLKEISFDCGDADLNEFFLKDSFRYLDQLLAVTYFFKHENTKEIVAYFSVLNDGIEADNRTKRKIPNEKRHKKIPAAKIGRLGVCKKYQKNGFGSKILGFIKYFFIHENKTGCRFLLADAYNKPGVIKFYRKNGFEFLTEEDEELETRAMKFDLKPFEMKMKEMKMI